MTRKPTTKSSDERRLRKHIRDLLKLHDPSDRLNTDATVREFLSLIDDEVRRARMSMAPVVFADNGPRNASPTAQHMILDGVTTVRRDFRDFRDALTCGGK